MDGELVSCTAIDLVLALKIKIGSAGVTLCIPTERLIAIRFIFFLLYK